MGTSLFYAIKQHSICKKLVLLVKDNAQFIKLQIIDSDTNYNHVSDADLIIIATPLFAYKEVLGKISKYKLLKHAIITDIGSVKEDIISLQRSNFPQINNLILSHPIAGSHLSGAGTYVKDLYDNKNVIIINENKTKSNIKLKTITSFWRAIGMNPLFLSAKQHDHIYAYMSHLVQKIAFSLKDALEHKNITIDSLKSDLNHPTFNCFIRLSNSNINLWQDIFDHNKIYLEEALAEFIAEIKNNLALIADDNYDIILDKIAVSKKTLARFKLSHPQHAITEPIYFIFAAIIAQTLSKIISNKKYYNYAGSGFKDIVNMIFLVRKHHLNNMAIEKHRLISMLNSLINSLGQT